MCVSVCSLYILFPSLSLLSDISMSGFLTSFTFLFKCHFFQEVSPDPPYPSTQFHFSY